MAVEATWSSPLLLRIAEAMGGFDPELKIRVYGNGSQTTPTKRWAAPGGYGIWVPRWNRSNDEDNEQDEESYCGGAMRQTGSSTRHELTACIFLRSLPTGSMYATDSASMLSKAKNDRIGGPQGKVAS